MRDDEPGGAASICTSARSGAASSAMAAAAAATKHTPMAASYGSKPGISAAAHPAPIFAADKLFDEFSLGRINARPSTSPGEGNANARIGILHQYQQQHQQSQPRPQSQPQPPPQPQPQPSYQPSAPPFECIGRSAAPLSGLDDIFGGVKGVKSLANDDVFFSLESNGVAASSPNAAGSPNASINSSSSSSSGGIRSVRTHQRSASCTSYPATCHQAASTASSPKVSKSSETTPSPPYVHGNSSTASTSAPSTPSSSKNTVRGTPVGGPGLSRFGAEGLNGNFVETREKDAVACQNRDTAEAVKVSGEKHSAEQKGSSGASVTPAISQKQPMVSADSNPGISRVGEAHATAKETRNPAGLSTASSPRQASGMASPHQGTAQKYQASAAEEILLPRAEGDSWNTREQQQHHAAAPPEDTSPSSHRKSRRQSATEKLKAVFFPDSSKKEDKGAKGNKGWFTVGDVKLVTQPTDVPPPSRAPPSSTVRQSAEFGRPKLSRDEKWRRKSCEFPSATEMSSEQPNGEDFAGLSSSAVAMREAVERAEAKLKQKQQNGGEAATAAASSSNPAIKVVLKEENKHRTVEREVEIDSRAVERAAHELREKALRKAAERAASKATRVVDNEVDGAPRSASAPRHRSTDGIERKSKKIFFSGPMAEKAVPDEAESPASTPSSAATPSQPEDEKSQRRVSSQGAAEERAARVLAEKNQRELSAQQEQAERQRVSALVDLRVRQWVTGKEGNLRNLLLTLQDVLWVGSGWQAVSSSELSNEAAIKKVYRRATLCLHPDKMQQKGASVEEKLIAEKVFDLLKEAWNRFSSQESFFWQAAS